MKLASPYWILARREKAKKNKNRVFFQTDEEIMEIIQMQKAAADRGSPICHRTAYPDPNKRRARTDITVPFVNLSDRASSRDPPRSPVAGPHH